MVPDPPPPLFRFQGRETWEVRKTPTIPQNLGAVLFCSLRSEFHRRLRNSVDKFGVYLANMIIILHLGPGLANTGLIPTLPSTKERNLKTTPPPTATSCLPLYSFPPPSLPLPPFPRFQGRETWEVRKTSQSPKMSVRSRPTHRGLLGSFSLFVHKSSPFPLFTVPGSLHISQEEILRRHLRPLQPAKRNMGDQLKLICQR